MSRISHQGNLTRIRYPFVQARPVDKLPINDSFHLFPDAPNSWIPSLKKFEYIVLLARLGPAFLDISSVLVSQDGIDFLSITQSDHKSVHVWGEEKVDRITAFKELVDKWIVSHSVCLHEGAVYGIPTMQRLIFVP